MSILVIVESPTKAKTIGKFLGKEYVVTSSYGHIRDLPKSAAEIPADVKKEKWSRLGINVDKNFEPLYIIPTDKKKRVQELKALVKDADEILLATDEDREGESISWHLLEVLKPKVKVKRLVFHEITKEAIKHSLENTREIDYNLVKAQETRRTIDRLFGYELSPLLWKKVAPRLSAGRVQSVAMRLIVERERARQSFVSATYWDLKANFEKLDSSGKFEAELTSVNGKRIAIGKDFNPDTGKLINEDTLLVDEKLAKDLESKLKKEKPVVDSIESKPFTNKPYAPFTTSTLQQEGSRKLRFSAKKTMSVAQTLYENGFITYMRTDSTSLSEQAITGSRNIIANEFGKEFLPDAPRTYQTKVKNAQEAHEAIRPAGYDFVNPEEVRRRLGSEAGNLYDLIWKRMLACQMKDAYGTRVSVNIKIGEANFRASGKTIEFAGFLRAYVEGSDDPEGDLADQEKVLPVLAKGEELKSEKLVSVEHATLPPARYTEGSLIKELERLGIGRPSTWATVVDVVLSRDYAYKKGTALVPTFLACVLCRLMENYFTKLVDYSFTAGMEDDLDAISRGEVDNLKYLNNFYFGNGLPGLKTLVATGDQTIDPRVVCGIEVGKTSDDIKIEVRVGKWGAFITDGTNRASLPDNIAPDELSNEILTELLAKAEQGPTKLGLDPATQKPIYIKTGRYGPYVQLGDIDPDDKKSKPKMASLMPKMEMEKVTFEQALELLALPKLLGKNPGAEEVLVYNGRFGPYLKAGTDNRTIPLDEFNPLEITLEQALELMSRPKTRGRGAVKATELKALGVNEAGKNISIKSGRYGPYVTDGEINASLPRGVDPANFTLEEGLSLLSDRKIKLENEPPKPKGRRKKK